MEVFAREVPNARQMALGAGGTLFVGSREHARQVYAVVDKDHDWKADKVFVVAKDLDLPSGVAFQRGALYIAANFQLLRLDDIEQHLSRPPQPLTLLDDLPRERYHGWRYLKFGPDELLYMPIGIPCDACVRGPPFGQLLRMNADGHNRETYAYGLRSVQGLAWYPQTQELWFSDNGRNLLGDDLPPDEINRITKPGLDFGAPYCHAGSIPDPELGSPASCDGFVPPAAKLPAHVSPLGIAFYSGDQFPEPYHDRLFIAEHGSWDSSIPVGYRISTLTLDDDGKPHSYEVFAEGWLNADGSFWGRPTDLLVVPDGSLLVSDDEAGVVYRISYRHE
jgi:glucose/arabinose dehydrogenase